MYHIDTLLRGRPACSGGCRGRSAELTFERLREKVLALRKQVGTGQTMKLFETNIRGRLLMAVGGAALLSACNVNIDQSGSTFNTNTNLDAEFSGNNTSVGSGSASSSGGQFVDQLANLSLEQQLAFASSQEDSAFINFVNNLNFYIDTSNSITGIGGAAYELLVQTDDKILSATTTIPIKQDINFLRYELNNENPGFAEVFVNITVPDNFDAFVLLATRRSDTTAFYIPDYFGGGLSDNGIYAGSGTIELPLLRGYSNDENPDLSVLGMFEVGDEVTLKWQNIDEDTYNFWFSVFNDGGDTPFSSATIAQSNINGGVGIWAGYNTSYTTITIQ